MITEEFLEQMQAIKDSTSNIEMNTGDLFRGVDEVLSNLDNSDDDSVDRFNFSEEDLDRALDRVEKSCDYVPFEIVDELKDVLCNFLPEMTERGQKYDTSNFSETLAENGGQFENISPIDVSVLQSGCTGKVMELAGRYQDLNQSIFELEEERAELEEDAFRILVDERWKEGSIDVLATLDDFEFESFGDTTEALEEYENAKEKYDELQAISDFVTGNKINDWNEYIGRDKLKIGQQYFGIDLTTYNFDRSDTEYMPKRESALRPAEDRLDELRERALHNSYYQSASKMLDDVDTDNDQMIHNALMSMRDEMDSFRENSEFEDTLGRQREIDEELEMLYAERDEVRQTIENFECPDSVPPRDIETQPGNMDQGAPLIVSDSGSKYIPENREYWDRWSNLATIVNLTNPASFWPIGIVIPTPSGLIKIPMPILWNTVAVIPTPVCLVVIFLGICGICPSPFVFLMDMTSRSSGFIASLRGPHTIRGSEETASKMDQNMRSEAGTEFGNYLTNGAEVAQLPLVQDDLPDWSRLNMTNIPFTFRADGKDGMLVAFNKKGKKGGGFFEQ